MGFSARKLLFLCSKFLILIIVFSVIFLLWMDSYNRLVIWGAEAVLTIFSAPLKIQITEGSNWAVFWRPSGERLFHSTGGREFLQLLYFNLPLLLSLIWVTPRVHIRRLLQITGLGLSLIFFSHVLLVIALITAEYVTHLRPEHLGYIWLKLFVSLGSQLFAVALWALLTWRSWFPKPAATAAALAVQKRKRRPHPKEARP